MAEHPLDNPVWASLQTVHAHAARRQGSAARYPPEMAPFVAVADPGAQAGADALALMSPGEYAYFVGVAPPVVAGALRGVNTPIAQMVYPAHHVPDDSEEGVVELGADRLPDMLGLTALVYPEYFRARTREMGHYFGVYADGQLAAMAGERMGTPQAQELSAICTHPAHLGRGHAGRLIRVLLRRILARRQRPFLHVSLANRRAIELYERVGFVMRREIGLWRFERAS